MPLSLPPARAKRAPRRQHSGTYLRPTAGVLTLREGEPALSLITCPLGTRTRRIAAPLSACRREYRLAIIGSERRKVVALPNRCSSGIWPKTRGGCAPEATECVRL